MLLQLAQKMEVLENRLSAFYTIESRLQQVEQFAAVNSQNSQSVKFHTCSRVFRLKGAVVHLSTTAK